MDLDKWKKWFAAHHEATFQDLFQFLRFKSIGTDPEFDLETRKCADWLVDYLSDIGLDAEKWESGGQPVVFAKHCGAGKDRPTLLIYQHYDVQPVDPIELWETDPFDPTIRNNNVYARGAQDNKGQCFYSITAIKALFEESDKLNFNLKLFIEGEEESGSTTTREIIAEKAEELKSDYILVVDSGIPAPGVGAVTLGLRGILTMDILLRSADVDMHSGALGGVAYNPIRALTHALSKLWDDGEKVAVPGFYDAVRELPSEEAKELSLEMDEEAARKEFGLRAFCPDPGYTIGQSVAIRPTVEINGIIGGYTGEGFKTVLPAIASAKLSCRLVPNQIPAEIADNIQAHLQEHTPKGLDLIIDVHEGFPAFQSSGHSFIAKLAKKAYEEVLGKSCQSVLAGGSIPIVTELANASGGEAIMMGYGLDGDQIHAPNEHFGLDRFEQGFLTMGRILSGLQENE